MGEPEPKLPMFADCKAPLELEHGFVTFSSRNNLTTYRAAIQYHCQHPYYHMAPNTTYTCDASGVWRSEELGTKLPSCRPGTTAGVRIIGGRNAEPGFFPWQALIVVEDMSRVPNDKWFGSGALLSDSWVLTAAHVLRSQRRDKTVIPVSKEHVTVYLALHDVRNKMEAVNRTVEKIILHEEFDIQNYNHDIALVKLKEKVTMGNYVMPVCLPQFEHELEGPHPNMLGLVAGWGISNPNITVDEIIMVLHAECKTSYESRSGNYSVTENMFCAGYYEGGKDTCLGDSGGAFVIQDPGTRRWVAQGLVSWGGPEECGSKQVYGVYTKVSNYVDWVEKKTGSSERWTFLEPELES
uniref:Mannan-binding lectin serine protease 1 n=1 Tax=Accipiter nisus TaxID=211598 RepID=A0A8B9MHG5_9AVES